MSSALRVLLVEDDAEDALLFRRYCPRHFLIQHVSSVDLALSHLRSERYDVCFTDYRLVADSGLDLVRQARDEGLRIPIVVITGQDVDALAENALLAGATDFMIKDELSPATIQRATRWSMIRRHVENQRDDGMSEAAIVQLLGRAPSGTDSPRRRDTPGLRRVIYLSRSRQALSQQELMRLCSRFSAANARTQISGVLVYIGECFMQVIEGEAIAVEQLMQRIQEDPRHGDLAISLDEVIGQRLFEDWNMGSLHTGKAGVLSPAQWIGLHQQFSRQITAQSLSRSAIATLVRNLSALLSAHPGRVEITAESRADKAPELAPGP